MVDKGKMTSKRIQVYLQNIDEQGRDLGEDLYLFVLDEKLILLEINGMHTDAIKNFDIEKLTVFRMDANVDKSVIGRALVGGVLAGGVGAVIGGMSATNQKKAWFCEIIEKDETISLYRIKDETSAMQLEKWYKKYQQKKK